MIHYGIVEDNENDPLKNGNVRVRVAGIHSEKSNELPTSSLPWAQVACGVTDASISGIGDTPRLLKGTMVLVIFVDEAYQKPIVIGTVKGAPDWVPSYGNVASELTANLVPETPPKSGPWIGSLTKDQIDILKLDYNATRAAYTDIANTVGSLATARPEKLAGLLSVAVNVTVADALKLLAGSDYATFKAYVAGYQAILGKSTTEYPLMDNLGYQAVDVRNTNNDALKYDQGATNVSTTPTFADPTGQYPLKVMKGKPDVPMLARGDYIGTIVPQKDKRRHLNVPVANSATTWSQSKIPYNTQYPFNRVQVSEAGHTIEVDDTPGAARLHWYHKAGSFDEIDDAGNYTSQTIGTRTVVVDQDELVHIKGNGSITVDGDVRILVKNALSVQVIGNVDMKVDGNVTYDVKGDFNVNAGGSIVMEAGKNAVLSGMGNVTLDGQMLNVAAAGTTLLGNLGAPILATGSYAVALQPLAQTAASLKEPNPYSILDRANQSAEESGTKQFEQHPPVAEPVTPTRDLDAVVAQRPTIKQPSCDFLTINESMLQQTFVSNYSLQRVIGKHPFPFKDGQHNLKPQTLLCNLKGLMINTVLPIMDNFAYANPVITNTFREAGSALSRSSNTSQHELGQAADIWFNVSALELFQIAQLIKGANGSSPMVPFDQLLLEYRGRSRWLHISFTNTPRYIVRTMLNDSTYRPDGDGLYLLG